MVFLRFVTLSVALLLGNLPAAIADEAKPAHKDSRLKPREAKFTSAVTPAQARPGDTVTYTITARIDPPYHIYAYAKTQPEEGPRSTQFDFFDKGGLEIAGDWQASREPIRKKEAAFPSLEAVEFYENEVSWSLKLKVPGGIEPGPKTLRCQVYFQICDPRACKPPAYVTVPDATLTILGGGAAPAATAEAAPAAPAPKEKDRARNPSQVSFRTSFEPGEAKPGQTVQYRVTAQLEPGWHIFALTHPGAEKTTFDPFDPGGLQIIGDWKADRDPIVKADPNAPGPELQQYFEGEVTWSLPLQVPSGAEPGSQSFRNQITFQVCSDQSCTQGRLTLPPAVLTVLP
ncbi:MAG: hypothetical protein IRY99_25530, partial [Isosphaeraceae bacterium]|nr:hypothetical protein [Isosphaeraceae bacterium]